MRPGHPPPSSVVHWTITPPSLPRPSSSPRTDDRLFILHEGLQACNKFGIPPPGWTKKKKKVSPMDEDEKRERRWRQRQKVVNCCKKFAAFLFSHIGLASMVVAYSILGGFLFAALEAPEEVQQRELIAIAKNRTIDTLCAQLLVILNLTTANTLPDKPVMNEFRSKVREVFTHFQEDVRNAVKDKGWDGNDELGVRQWSFAGALLYAVTVITTIGYGHIAPKTDMGRLLTIVYALIGIPLTFLYLSTIGNFLADCFRLFYKRVCCDVLCCQKCYRKRRREHLRMRRRRELTARVNDAASTSDVIGKYAPSTRLYTMLAPGCHDNDRLPVINSVVGGLGYPPLTQLGREERGGCEERMDLYIGGENLGFELDEQEHDNDGDDDDDNEDNHIGNVGTSAISLSVFSTPRAAVRFTQSISRSSAASGTDTDGLRRGYAGVLEGVRGVRETAILGDDDDVKNGDGFFYSHDDVRETDILGDTNSHVVTLRGCGSLGGVDSTAVSSATGSAQSCVLKEGTALTPSLNKRQIGTSGTAGLSHAKETRFRIGSNETGLFCLPSSKSQPVLCSEGQGGGRHGCGEEKDLGKRIKGKTHSPDGAACARFSSNSKNRHLLLRQNSVDLKKHPLALTTASNDQSIGLIKVADWRVNNKLSGQLLGERQLDHIEGNEPIASGDDSQACSAARTVSKLKRFCRLGHKNDTKGDANLQIDISANKTNNANAADKCKRNWWRVVHCSKSQPADVMVDCENSSRANTLAVTHSDPCTTEKKWWKSKTDTMIIKNIAVAGSSPSHYTLSVKEELSVNEDSQGGGYCPRGGGLTPSPSPHGSHCNRGVPRWAHSTNSVEMEWGEEQWRRDRRGGGRGEAVDGEWRRREILKSTGRHQSEESFVTAASRGSGSDVNSSTAAAQDDLDKSDMSDQPLRNASDVKHTCSGILANHSIGWGGAIGDGESGLKGSSGMCRPSPLCDINGCLPSERQNLNVVDPFEYNLEEDDDDEGNTSKVMVPISICLLIIGSYIVAGSALFTLWEKWGYLEGSYFCFITLSTIGFGDIVPGTDMSNWQSNEKLVLCALWLAFGLSLLAMCFNLMQEEVKDKCKWLGQKLGILVDEDENQH